MKRILLAVLLLTATSAWAEWEKIGETDNSVIYIDRATIRKDGIFRKMWQLSNLKERHKDGQLSDRRLSEYDCKEERIRVLSLSTHSEQMAEGKTLLTYNAPTGWVYAPPSSTGELLLKIVCAK